MEFRDLKRQYQTLKEDIDVAINQVLTECNFISGKQVSKLEEELSEYVGVKHCITCANGTDALSLAMMAWNIGEGDAVFVPDFTFFSTGEIVAFAGATPIFVDVESDTFNMSVESLEYQIKKVLNEGKLIPKAVIPVDLFGLPADYEKIERVAKKYNLKILEDGAQGFGGECSGKRACSFGEISTTSFFPAKPLGCYGDGGAVFTNDDNLADLLKSIRIHGKGAMKYDNIRIGMNSRLDTIQAAILSVKLKAFKDYELDRVNAVANEYTKRLSDIVKTPIVSDNFKSSWAQYTIQLKDSNERDELQKELRENEIPSMVYYPKPMHLQQAFSDRTFETNEYVNTNKLCDTVLALPMHPYLEIADIDKITEIIKEYCNK